MKNEEKTCPQCGNEIPEGSPAGMCPQCLLAGAAAPTEVGAGPSADARPAPPTIDEVAAAFPQLEILDLIGQGGMGFVFRARQTILERDVALKILPQHLAEDPKFAERFTREGKLLAKLNHQNIVSIFDFGESGGFFYLMMEFVDGVNLRQAMRASRFTPEQALSIVPSICEALQFAHDEGVLHRDIKPENILLDSKGRVKIADFGIAKLVERGSMSHSSDEAEAAAESPGSAAPKEAASGGGPALREITQEGSSLGTPNYMAPEQIGSPSDVDHRADIYSLGVVFYELLTGELPSSDLAPPSSKTPLNPQVDEVVLRALEKERERRQSSATEFRTQVEIVSQLGDAGYGAKRTFDPPSATDPDRSASTRSGLACALGTVLFYTGLVCGYPLLGVFKLGQIALPLLLVVLFLSVTFCLHWGLGFGTATPTAEQARRARSLFVPFSIIAAILSLPVGGLGIFFLFALFEELFQTSSGWNPGLMEAVVVPLAILGTFLLPWSSWRLWREVRGKSADHEEITEHGRSRHGDGGSGQPVGNLWPSRVFWLIVAIICVPVGLLVIAVLIPMLAYQAAETPTTEPEPASMEEMVGGVPRATFTTEGTMRGEIAGGAFELVAVANNPAEGHWWRPDGAAVPNGFDFDVRGATVGTINTEGWHAYQFVFRGSDLPEFDPQPIWNAVTPGSNMRSYGAVYGSDNVGLDDYHVFGLGAVSDQDTMTVQARLAVGEWETLSKSGHGGRGFVITRKDFENDKVKMTWSPTSRGKEKGIVKVVSHNLDPGVWQIRLVAFDENFVEMTPGESESYENVVTAEFPELELEERLNFGFQVRKYERVEFSGIKLSPNQ